MTTKLEFKESMGKCVSEGAVIIEHDFETVEQLKQYVRENWFDLENAEKIRSAEFELYTNGDFLLTINEVTNE